MAVLGVDGWRGTWVGALLDGRTVTLLALPDAVAVLAVPDVDVIAIDMPIGLSSTGRRPCDDAARRRLGRAGSSVFPAPLRPVLSCGTYEDACRVSRAATTAGVAQRIRALEPALTVLDALAAAPPGVPVADCLDACALAWSARRIADGVAECVGDGSLDARGRPMRVEW